jgi:hypothetical protein
VTRSLASACACLPALVGRAGRLDPPLGQNRLKILEVVLALVSLKSPEVEAKLMELSVLPTVMDLFFAYEWHNLLHNLVKTLLEIVITGEVARLARFYQPVCFSRVVGACVWGVDGDAGW